MKFLSRRMAIRLLLIASVFTLAMGWWIGWGDGPNPESKALPWRPDAILVLGGGNEERPREAMRLHREFPNIPVIVTGDSGMIVEALEKAGMSAKKILHEESAESTIENAEFTDSILDELNADKVILVTNWFHVPRALAVFEKYQPEREFVVSFEAKPAELNDWHTNASRRERMATLFYLLRYQVWSF